MAWNEQKPAGTDFVRDVDNQIRQDKITLRTALDAEHVFNEDDQSGLHRPGAAVLLRDVEANLGVGGNTARAGRIFYATDTHKLFIGTDADPSVWQRESLRHHVARGTCQQYDQSLTETAWTALPVDWLQGPAGYTEPPTADAVTITTLGDEASMSYLLLTAQFTARCLTDGAAVFFAFLIKRPGEADYATCTNAPNGLAVVPHIDTTDAGEGEFNRTLTMVWLDVGPVPDFLGVPQGDTSVQICYRVSGAGVQGRLTPSFSASLSVVQL